MNEFMVSSQGDSIRIMRHPTGPGGPITKAQAINLAAWLVALADERADKIIMPGRGPDSDFQEALEEALSS